MRLKCKRKWAAELEAAAGPKFTRRAPQSALGPFHASACVTCTKQASSSSSFGGGRTNLISRLNKHCPLAMVSQWGMFNGQKQPVGQ